MEKCNMMEDSRAMSPYPSCTLLCGEKDKREGMEQSYIQQSKADFNPTRRDFYYSKEFLSFQS